MYCDYLTPRGAIPNFGDGYLPCLLRKGHSEEHLSQRADGKYIIWLPDSNCGCADEDCGCFEWDYITAEEARDLRKRGLVARW
ncbi:MAG: hypothetical protein HYT12_04445 [Candidatus Liptonbacteria bacterium]|nr:hypothetical protein [Candidatus Liptonbacteria bacterium]